MNDVITLLWTDSYFNKFLEVILYVYDELIILLLYLKLIILVYNTRHDIGNTVELG